jgi:HEXXH motif-containing protein
MRPNHTSSGDVCSPIDPTYRGFAGPFEPIIEGFVPFIIGEYARGLTRALVELHGEDLASTGPRLPSYLAPWFDGADLPGAGWDPSFGDAYRAMHVGTPLEITTIVAGVATHLGSLGLAGSWECELVAPVRLRWGDLLLPPATSVQVESDSSRAIVQTRVEGGEPKRFELERQVGGWACEELESLLVVTRHGVHIRVLTRGALVVRDFDELVSKALPTVDPRMVTVLDEAVELIHEFAPTYVPWVRRALHHMFILEPRKDTIESGSVEHYPGLIHLSAHAHPLPMAELLVHEAAHQHMNTLAKVGAVDDGSDTQRYYSPPVDKHRKVSLIVAAYHAFANVLLFYRMCERNGLDNVQECRRQERILLPWMEQLERPLRDNPALTDIGRALWLPLRDQLHET